MTNGRPCRFFTHPASETRPEPSPLPAWTPLPYLGWQQSVKCNPNKESN